MALTKYFQIYSRKPKLGAEPKQIGRYVNDKYVKGKYAAEGDHPVKLYKAGKVFQKKTSNQHSKSESPKKEKTF